MQKIWKAASMVAATTVLAACASMSWLSGGTETVTVDDAGVSVSCPASGQDPWVREFPSLDAVRSWQADNDLQLLTPGAEPGRYAIVGMGQRNSGGYGIAVSRAAEIEDGVLRLKATFVAPRAGAMTTQMISSPCALVRLPREAGWQSIEVYDQTGRLRVTLRTVS